VTEREQAFQSIVDSLPVWRRETFKADLLQKTGGSTTKRATFDGLEAVERNAFITLGGNVVD